MLPMIWKSLPSSYRRENANDIPIVEFLLHPSLLSIEAVIEHGFVRH